MRFSSRWCVAAFATVLMLAGVAIAQSTPQAIKIQGYLSDTSGGMPVPANGLHSILFEIFDASAGGNVVVSVGPLMVSVSDGRYEAELPVAANLFESPNRHLEITVNGELLAPRIRLVSVPYAFNSERAASVAPDSIDADSLATGAVTLDALGIVCGDGQILVYTVGTGWSCGTPTGGGAPVCDLGTYAHCYTGPTGTMDVGACRSGQAACRQDQTGFESCSGEITPSTDSCGNMIDEDCDGTDAVCEICDDMVDNDGDMLVDCADPDCAMDPACTCADNDGDGFADIGCGGTDCNDSNVLINPAATDICDNLVDEDCDGTDAVCEICDDTMDNDGDMLVDCADPDCAMDPACTCADNDGDGFADIGCGGTDCNDSNVLINPAATDICDNLVDEDCDGTDAVCEICDDTMDNDGDMLVDCADPDCAMDPACTCADNDGDGFADIGCGGTDCNDSNVLINPAATDICDNLVDEDCDGTDAVCEICDDTMDNDGDMLVDCADPDCAMDPACTCADNDGDGFADIGCGGTDCNDSNVLINPAATDICDNLVDEDCDGMDAVCEICNDMVDNDGDMLVDCADPDCAMDTNCTCVDADADGFTDSTCGGTDCDDSDASINPAATDICGNMVDENCDGMDAVCEICNDMVDNDGDMLVDCADPDCAMDTNCTCVDADADGFTDSTCGGTDCDDSDASINPAATDICGNMVDENCDGMDAVCEICNDMVDNDGDMLVDCADPDCAMDTNCTCVDADADGFTDSTCGGTDCDDSDASINPAATDICGNMVDENCDGMDAVCEICNDMVDNDGDMLVDCADPDCVTDPSCTCVDADADGFTDSTCGGTDCDDSDASINPAATDICGNMVDENCDGMDAVCEICNDMVDNDGDMLVDCADPDCAMDTNCTCVDADADGFTDSTCGGTDCDDSDASINPAATDICGNMVDENCDGMDAVCEICNDMVDNDGDMLVDCADPDCVTDPSCTCVDADADGFTDSTCGGTDCDDSDASINPAATDICGNMVDENCDGMDAVCEICDDMVDNDGDMLVDCADPDCATFPTCT